MVAYVKQDVVLLFIYLLLKQSSYEIVCKYRTIALYQLTVFDACYGFIKKVYFGKHITVSAF